MERRPIAVGGGLATPAAVPEPYMRSFGLAQDMLSPHTALRTMRPLSRAPLSVDFVMAVGVEQRLIGVVVVMSIAKDGEPPSHHCTCLCEVLSTRGLINASLQPGNVAPAIFPGQRFPIFSPFTGCHKT